MLELARPRGAVRIQRTLKLLPTGALSIGVRVPFTAERLEELVNYHDLAMAGGSLSDEVRKLAEELCRELQPHLVRPHAHLAADEAYTVFCLESPLLDGERDRARRGMVRRQHPREVAALLTEEPDPERLSQQETEESTARYLSYYGLIRSSSIGIRRRSSTNRKLPGFPASDGAGQSPTGRVGSVRPAAGRFPEQAYRDMRSRGLRSRAAMLRDLRELRIDLTRLSDELSNTTKFFGDWHLARLYEALASRFHLGHWHRSIDEELHALGELYGLLAQDRTNRPTLILEVTIVLLFIADIVMLFVRGVRWPVRISQP